MALAGDGSVICVGQTYGSWDGDAKGGSDFAALRLDGNGEEIWRYQVGFSPKRELVDRTYECYAHPPSPITDRRIFRSSKRWIACSGCVAQCFLPVVFFYHHVHYT